MRTIKELTRAIDLNPSEPDNFHRRGWAYYELNKYEKAIEDITKAIDLKSDNPYSYHLRGWANYKLKKYEKALKDTKKAIELTESNNVMLLHHDELDNLEKILTEANLQDIE